MIHMLILLVPLEEIPYLDYPELLINEHERTEMPFRYVKDADGKPIMPDVSLFKLLISEEQS
jgi:ribosome biogenesis SPOUT family RNA methylase Rps3